MSRRIDLLAAADLAPGTMQLVWVDGGASPVLVVNDEGSFRAVQGICSHEYYELDRGLLNDSRVTCLLHLSSFDLANGDVLEPPADMPLAVYDVVVEEGRVLIEAPEGPLPVNE